MSGKVREISVPNWKCGQGQKVKDQLLVHLGSSEEANGTIQGTREGRFSDVVMHSSHKQNRRPIVLKSLLLSLLLSRCRMRWDADQ